MATVRFSRRRFIQTASAGASAFALSAPGKALGANDKITLGIIGSGGRGRRLLQAITNIPDFQVAAVCDLVPERMDQAAAICEQYQPPVRKYLDFRVMFEKEKLDACLVATEEGNHAKCAIPVMEAGIHCFCEKPMDISVENVDRVTRAARKAKTVYQIGFQRHYIPTFQSCMKHIHEGGIGKVTFLQGMWHWAYGVGGRYLDMDIAGSWFLAQACHHADAMMWAMNGQKPLHCCAMAINSEKHENPPAHCAEDHSAIVYQFPGDVVFSYTHLMNCCEEFTGEKLWVYGEKAGINLPEGMKYPRPGQGEPVKLGEKVTDWDNGTYEELEAFARHIRNNETPLSNVETGRLSTLMGIMGGMAMYNRKKSKLESTMVTWKDLGTTT
ncbi:MAG: Gfo/Idh/MocA family oxidoreductase [Candidatus Omnitrophota bacterium]